MSGRVRAGRRRQRRAPPAWIVCGALAAGVLAACGGGGGGGDGGPPAPPFGLAQRVAVAPLPFPARAPGGGEVRFERQFPNASFIRPLQALTAPGEPRRLYVVGQWGAVRQMDLDDPAGRGRPFMDLSGQIVTEGEQGLLSLAFHPDYVANGWLYTFYSLAGSTDSVISRWTVRPDRLAVDPASERVLLQFSNPPGTGHHRGGQLAFGPDGYLYASTGDGGIHRDPQGNAQNLGVLMGKILRLDENGRAPADNPYVGTAGARPQIWASGLRNPWRFAFDRVTGELWTGDVGEGGVEEIDIIRRGGNYGWNVFEGDRPFDNPQGRPYGDFDAPVLAIPHIPGGASITGGFVYRGRGVPSLTGQYLHADLISGEVFALTWDGSRVLGNRLLGSVVLPAAFGEDADGEAYVVSIQPGRLWRLLPDDAPPGEFPQQLSDTRLFRNLATLEPAAGLIEYEVNAPLWSDGARKRRWLALPGAETIGFAADGAWAFPAGTVLVKHFEMALAGGAVQRLETRVLVNHEEGWQGYTYRWNESQTDARLLGGGETVMLTVPDAAAPGGTREQLYEFPDRAACLGCHTAASGQVLGMRTAQLNRDFDYGAITDNQLRSFQHIGLFAPAAGNPATLPRQADPADAGRGLAERARSYLDANCSHCHQPGGPAPVAIDLRRTVSVAQMRVRDVAPSAGDLGIAGARIVAPGAHARSVLWSRMQRLDQHRMPPLASHAVDAEAVQLVADWIDAGAQ